HDLSVRGARHDPALHSLHPSIRLHEHGQGFGGYHDLSRHSENASRRDFAYYEAEDHAHTGLGHHQSHDDVTIFGVNYFVKTQHLNSTLSFNSKALSV
ncbi:hypothetical protein PENTCL1PPCAC_9874, partial [Pristionchus entomophagus]